jgi:hypothetical protein
VTLFVIIYLMSQQKGLTAVDSIMNTTDASPVPALLKKQEPTIPTSSGHTRRVRGGFH